MLKTFAIKTIQFRYRSLLMPIFAFFRAKMSRFCVKNRERKSVALIFYPQKSTTELCSVWKSGVNRIGSRNHLRAPDLSYIREISIKKTSENPALSQWNFHSFFICIGCCYLLNFMLLFRDEDQSGSALEFLKENKVLVVLIEKIVGSLELRLIRLLGL